MTKHERKIRILYVVNKQLPSNDYRINYSFNSEISEIHFAMPGRTQNLPEEWFTLMEIREGFRLSYIIELFHLFFLLRKNVDHYDVVHYYSTILTLIGPIISIMVGIPAIITITGFGRTYTSHNFRFRVLKPLYNFLFLISLSFSEAVFFQNFSDLSTLRKKYPRFSDKFFYAGSAVDLEVIDNKDKDFFTQKLNVLLIARLNHDKGIEDFLAVAKQLKGNQFNFTLVGPKTIGEDELFAKVKQHAELDIINYLGELDVHEITKLFKTQHVFFFPSYGEGMARVMLEAGFGCTCPIAYDIPANRDLISNSNGFLFTLYETDSVIKKLTELYENRDLLKAKALTYQKDIMVNYNIRIYTKRIDAILKILF